MTNEERARRFRLARTDLNPGGAETLMQVHEATGVAMSALSELENPSSSRFPSAKNLSRLAQHYKVNAAWLSGQSDSWSLEEDYRIVTDLLGLSPSAVDKLKMLMADDVKKAAINSLIESKEFDRLIRSISVLADYSGEPPRVETGMDTVDYGRVIRKYGDDPNPLSFTFAEGDVRSYLAWKVSRDMDALIDRMIRKEK